MPLRGSCLSIDSAYTVYVVYHPWTNIGILACEFMYALFRCGYANMNEHVAHGNRLKHMA